MPLKKIVNTCCGVFTLQAGSYAIGILNAFSSLLAVRENSTNFENPVFLLNTLAALGLLYGVYSRNTAMIELYLIFSALSLAILGVMLLAHPLLAENFVALFWLSGIIGLLVNVYCYVVVYSYYVELSDRHGINL